MSECRISLPVTAAPVSWVGHKAPEFLCPILDHDDVRSVRFLDSRLFPNHEEPSAIR